MTIPTSMKSKPHTRRRSRNGSPPSRRRRLASVNHSIAEVDKWEAAHFKEDEIREKVKAAKQRYDDALRQKFFGF